MVRGKYAAKANGQRAQAAQDAAGALQIQIGDMRREHAVEVTELKAQVSALQGQLLREVRNLAAAEVWQVRNEAQVMLAAERTDRRVMVEKVAHLLKVEQAKMRPEAEEELAKLLGLELGEFLAIRYAGDLNRSTSRMTSAHHRHGKDLQRQRRTLSAVAPEHPDGREDRDDAG